MRWFFYISVVALLGGCSLGEWPDVERGESELRARDIVWASYGATSEAPPVVSWTQGEDCTYYTMPGKYFLHDGRCLLGFYHEPEHQAWVVSMDKISDSAYAHEMYHAWLWIHTGDLDKDHLNAGWSTVVWHANDLLRAEAL